jgi:uncharacterized membrane protein YidH (DUF202 family)
LRCEGGQNWRRGASAGVGGQAHGRAVGASTIVNRLPNFARRITGVVVERLNLFLAAVAEAILTPASPHGADFLRPFRQYEGLALGLLGVVIIVFGGIRFVMTAREIDRTGGSFTPGHRAELVLTGALALLAAFFCLSLAVP